jgi:hypothetical protein
VTTSKPPRPLRRTLFFALARALGPRGFAPSLWVRLHDAAAMIVRKPSLALVLVLAGCAGGDATDSSCASAVDQYELLRAGAIGHDPALSAHPDLAAEHLRQTREVFDAPVRARCAEDPRVARCIAASASLADADTCLGEQP